MSDKKITIIVPCFNEAENIPILYREIRSACCDLDTRILFIDDGSSDETVNVICELKSADDRIGLISFVRNRGHQIALRAGITHATGDYLVMLDADLQHPPRYIPQMVETAERGYDVVTMVRRGRQRGWAKNLLSWCFYRIFTLISGVHIEPGASDFRLITRTVQNIIRQLPERNLFFRVLIPELGFPQKSLAYELEPRRSGTASFSFAKSFQMAESSLFNYSTLPIRVCFNLGVTAAGLAFIYGLFHVFAKIFTDWNVPGFTDIIASVLFLGGLNLAMLATVAKYIQVAMEHLKQHPEYIIDRRKSDF